MALPDAQAICNLFRKPQIKFEEWISGESDDCSGPVNEADSRSFVPVAGGNLDPPEALSALFELKQTSKCFRSGSDLDSEPRPPRRAGQISNQSHPPRRAGQISTQSHPPRRAGPQLVPLVQSVVEGPPQAIRGGQCSQEHGTWRGSKELLHLALDDPVYRTVPFETTGVSS